MPMRGQALRGLRFGRRLGRAPLFSRGLLTQSYARGPSQVSQLV